jgi:hypothetical protein
MKSVYRIFLPISNAIYAEWEMQKGKALTKMESANRLLRAEQSRAEQSRAEQRLRAL